MASQTFWDWVTMQVGGEELYTVPEVSESSIATSIDYICETSYFYRGSETWAIEAWDEHMEFYFLDIRNSKEEIARRRVYRFFRDRYAQYAKGNSQPESKSRHRSASNRPKRAISLGLRWQVLDRDGRRCQMCGASPAADDSVKLHVDHIVPVSRGGLSSIENLQTLCAHCNLGKSDRMPIGAAEPASTSASRKSPTVKGDSC